MLKFIQNNREITALLAVVLLFVLPGFLDRQYLSVQTLTMVYSSAQILILLAMGATLVMLTRNIDVSVGSITGMCAVLLGMLLNAGYSLPVACVATLLLGLLAGFFNGVLVAWLKIPAIVATLGTLGLYRGIMLLWTGGKWIEGLPAELKQLSAPLLLGVSAIGWLTIILVAFMAWLLAKTAFGRSFYATGDNLHHSLFICLSCEKSFLFVCCCVFFSPSINKCCLYTIPCACTLCIVQKSSTKIVFPVLRWHCCKVPAYWCLSCLCILSICFYKRVVRKVI